MSSWNSYLPMRVHLGERNWILEPTPSLFVEVDVDRLTQVMLNLLRNAVEHTQPGQVIAVGAERDGGWARISVRDEGEGIPQTRLKEIFNRFYTRKSDGKPGYGLGLSIAEALIKAHGGRIEVNSTVGEGSTFAVLLPVVTGETGPSDPGPPEFPSLLLTESARGKRRGRSSGVAGVSW